MGWINCEFVSWQGKETFLFPKMSRLALGPTQPPTKWKLGFQGSSPGVKWLGHGVYHSPPCRAEVKNGWNYTSTPPYMLSWCRQR